MDGEMTQRAYKFAVESGGLSLILRTCTVEEETLTPDSRSPLTSMQTLAGVQGRIHTQGSIILFRKKKCSWHKGCKHISTRVSYVVQDLTHLGSTTGDPEYSELGLPTAIIFKDNLSLTWLLGNMTLETPQLRSLLVWVKSRLLKPARACSETSGRFIATAHTESYIQRYEDWVGLRFCVDSKSSGDVYV